MKIKRVVIGTTGVSANNVARGVMTLCCDLTLRYITETLPILHKWEATITRNTELA